MKYGLLDLTMFLTLTHLKLTLLLSVGRDYISKLCFDTIKKRILLSYPQNCNPPGLTVVTDPTKSHYIH